MVGLYQILHEVMFRRGLSQLPQVKGRGRVEELKKCKRGTRDIREMEQELMRGTTGGQKMYNRGTTEVHQRPYSKPRTHNTQLSIPFLLFFFKISLNLLHF